MEPVSGKSDLLLEEYIDRVVHGNALVPVFYSFIVSIFHLADQSDLHPVQLFQLTVQASKYDQ